MEQPIVRVTATTPLDLTRVPVHQVIFLILMVLRAKVIAIFFISFFINPSLQI
jgi:hypothetical protein